MFVSSGVTTSRGPKGKGPQFSLVGDLFQGSSMGEDVNTVLKEVGRQPGMDTEELSRKQIGGPLDWPKKEKLVLDWWSMKEEDMPSKIKVELLYTGTGLESQVTGCKMGGRGTYAQLTVLPETVNT